ncbi:MAG: DUF4282 domain-containing protein [Candidatus Thermoplasmatota archaeon]|nr:DUF4282 domain-containing protein [Candidatus Thermoplasmatota archaeon]
MARRRTFGNFFTFRWMITPGIIRIFYVIGLILDNLLLLAATIGGIAAMIIIGRDLELDTLIIVGSIVGILVLSLITFIIMNLLWRMFCEQIILFFSLHEMLSTIEGDVRERIKERKRKEKEEKEEEVASSDEE